MTTSFPAFLIPEDEAARLRTLHHYQIVNTTPEKVFDDYVAWAAQLFNTPIALISLVDEHEVYFKAVAGAEGVTVLPRTDSMCSAAILPNEPVVTTDYTLDSCQLIKPDVAQALGLNFYAGSALRMPDGSRIGMLAVIGREVRSLSSTEAKVLNQLAELVSSTIELRLRYRTTQQQELWQRVQQEISENLDENAALARYLISRNQRINLDDDNILEPVLKRLKSVEQMLQQRLVAVTEAA